jgi:hypothetical protein
MDDQPKEHNNQLQAAAEETLAAVATSIAMAMAKAAAAAMSRRVMGHRVWGRCVRRPKAAEMVIERKWEQSGYDHRRKFLSVNC